MTATLPAPVLIFGHDAPLSHPLLAGLAVGDITRHPPDAAGESRIAGLLEPFLDPFARTFLTGLEQRRHDGAAAIVVWRNGAGALHAYRHACQLRAMGLLPPGPPLHLWNEATADTPAAQAFNRAEAARLVPVLAGLARGAPCDRATPLARLAALQSEGRIGGAEAFRRRLAARRTGLPVDAAVDTAPNIRPTGPRLALAGAPLGADGLHRALEARGVLALDLQGPDAPPGDPAALLRAHRIDRLYWQVDPHDDLHGWRRPAMARLCADQGIGFVDLGFVPTWPDRALAEGLLP